MSLKKEWENLSSLTKVLDKYKNKQDSEMLLIISEYLKNDGPISDLLINIHNFERERKIKRILNEQ